MTSGGNEGTTVDRVRYPHNHPGPVGPSVPGLTPLPLLTCLQDDRFLRRSTVSSLLLFLGRSWSHLCLFRKLFLGFGILIFPLNGLFPVDVFGCQLYELPMNYLGRSVDSSPCGSPTPKVFYTSGHPFPPHVKSRDRRVVGCEDERTYSSDVRSPRTDDIRTRFRHYRDESLGTHNLFDSGKGERRNVSVENSLPRPCGSPTSVKEISILDPSVTTERLDHNN